MPLKIALLTYSTKPRGSVVHTLELAQALADSGHHPYVFALDKNGEGFYRPVEFETFAVPASVCDGNTDQLIRQRIQEFVSFFQQHLNGHEGYDIYHAQDCLSANALAELKAQGKLSQFVRTVHHIEAFKSPYLRECQEKSIYLSDRCLCVSALWQQILQKDYGITAHRVINGVSTRFSAVPAAVDAGIAKAYGIYPKADNMVRPGLVYLTVGGIEPRKNSINLLKAFARVHQQQPSAQLVIVGGATLFDYQPYRDDFWALAKAKKLENALIFPGIVLDQHLPSLYRLADAFVFPSIQEGWGLVVLEALASKVPVIASDQAPFTEFLSSASARLVNPQSEDSIAAAMLEVIRPDVAQGLRAHSEEIISCYSWGASAKMHIALYEQLVTCV